MNVVLVYRGRYHIREALDLEALAAVLRRGGTRAAGLRARHVRSDRQRVSGAVLARLLQRDERTVGRIVGASGGGDFSVLSSTYAWCRSIAAAVGGGPRSDYFPGCIRRWFPNM